MVARRFTPLTNERTLAVRVLLVSLAGACLGACSTMHRTTLTPPPPPPPAELERHGAPVQTKPAAQNVPKGCVDEKCSRRVIAAHRQYFDQRHKRYYFYDPARRAYFWEDGTPKS